MAPTDPNRGDARERIVRATFELVAAEGLGSVTMTAIADQADVARQTLYNHFTDVEQIVIAGIEEYNDVGFAHLTELLEATATTEAKLDLLVRHTVAATSHGHAVADLRSALSAQSRAHLDQHVTSFRSLIESIIAGGVAEGTLDESLDPGVYAVLIEGLLLAAGDLATGADDPSVAATVTSAAILRVLGVGNGADQASS
jgi:AcrR family transcriptional regulator